MLCFQHTPARPTAPGPYVQTARTDCGNCELDCSRLCRSRLPAVWLGSSSQLVRSCSNAHKLFEERQLARHALQRLRVPLNRNDEWPRRILDRLDRSVRRPSARTQAGTEAVDCLVMKRVNAQLSSAQHRRQPAAGKNRDRMGRNTAIDGLAVCDHIASDIREVLVQSAAARDIERLDAATDPQDRKLEAKGLPGNRVLEAVKAGFGRAQLLMWFGAVGSGGEIRTTREHQRIQPPEQPPDVSASEWGHNHRKRAGGLERPHVGHPEGHLGIGRLAVAAQRRKLARAQLGRSHPNQWLHPVRIAANCGSVYLHVDKDRAQSGRLQTGAIT